MRFASLAARIAATAVFLLNASAAAFGQSGTGVFTFHNNYQRWGWNASETVLTPSALSAKASKFGVIATVDGLDAPAYAQPLIVPGISISCPTSQTVVTCETGATGVHDVAFVATSLDTLYAIDADTGAILLKRNFGAIGFCGGIWSTPVIDSVKGILYLMSPDTENGVQTFKLFAIGIGNLADVLPPYTVTGKNTSDPMSNGVTYDFQAAKTCQRPSLLLLGGKIYAGFSGIEYDNAAGRSVGPSRGWLMGWNASDLAPMTPLLTNQQASSTHRFYLSSIWMSGAGIASDGTNLYFVTGNSDPSGLSYDPVKNVEESVVEVTPDLKITSVFTPFDYAYLDRQDLDFGAGGVMLLPTTPPLAVAAGKEGKMFLLNGNSLGGFTPGGPDNVVGWYRIGACWCAPSLYQNADGTRVVSSGGSTLMTWKLWPGTGGANPKLIQDGKAELPPTIQNPGFFTSVSSNGGDDAVIWAVGRPSDSTWAVTLYAYDGAPSKGVLTLLGSYPAGTWIQAFDQARNLLSVPVIANGKVYVLSGNAATPSGTLTIFGMLP